MKIQEHIYELKWRSLYLIMSIVITGCIVYTYQKTVIKEILRIEEIKIIYTHPAEAFISYIYIGIILGLLLNIPYIAYHIYKYMEGGLYRGESKRLKGKIKWMITIWVIWSIILGVEVIPYIVEKLRWFETETVGFVPKMNEIIKFYIQLYWGMMITILIPMIIILIEEIEIRKITNKRQYIVITSLIIGGIITPPDIISQIIVGGILIIGVEIGIIIKIIKREYKKLKN